jgi:hypothetical protein
LYSLTTGGLFKSTDGGSSWEASGNIGAVNVIALEPRPASTVYAGTSHGIVTSADGGAIWVSAGLSDTSVGNLAADPITRSTLLATSIRVRIDEGLGPSSTSVLHRAIKDFGSPVWLLTH